MKNTIKNTTKENMTPKQKARRIVKQMLKHAHTRDDDYVFNGAENYYHNAKKCALIAVNHIIKSLESDCSFVQEKQKFYKEVKKEIQKL